MNWKVIGGPNFASDLASLPEPVRSRVEEFSFELLPSTKNPFQLGKLEQLREHKGYHGHKGYHKVRFGRYRLGLHLDTKRKEIHLLRVMHRKDIYRYFP